MTPQVQMDTETGYLEIEYRAGVAELYITNDVSDSSMLFRMSLDEVLTLASEINRTLGEHK